MPDLYRLLQPMMMSLDAEKAHGLTIRLLKSGLSGMIGGGRDYPELETSFLNMRLPNPIGLAAGFDKNAMVPNAMLRLGFGFVEVGTVTPRPQAGNPQPRIFRLKQDNAVINRIGFANDGADLVTKRLSSRRARGRTGIVGINIGANKDSEDRIEDYVTGLRRFAGLGDYFTINISSPNTPGLRDLQDRSALADLVLRLMEERERLGGQRNVPLLIKIAPDLDEKDCEDIAHIALETRIDGLIVSNTTLDRPDTLNSSLKTETGGLSGAPLKAKSLDTLRHIYRQTDGKVPLIGVGGIASGADAYERIKAGASVVQLYTALVFEGPGLVKRMKRDLAVLLKENGFASVADAVGQDAKH